MFWTNFAIDLLLVCYVTVSVIMGFAIMMQRSKQEGLGAAFGQSIAGEIFGTGVSSFLVKATVWCAILFFVLSISLARLYAHKAMLKVEGSTLQQQLSMPITPAPHSAAPTAPAVTPPAPVPATK